MCSANQDTKYNQHDCSYSFSFFCLFPLQPQPWDQNVNTCHVYYTLIKLFQQSSPFPPPLSLDNSRAFDGGLWLGKGGGEFNPCLARVRKLSWKCQVFPTENTCFIFSYWGVYKVMGSLFQGEWIKKKCQRGNGFHAWSMSEEFLMFLFTIKSSTWGRHLNPILAPRNGSSHKAFFKSSNA